MPHRSRQFAHHGNASLLPPGQQLAAADRWPIVGERRPASADAAWNVEVVGLVSRPARWSLSELAAKAATELAVDIHCVTRWSKLGVLFAGVLLEHLLDESGIDRRAKFVSFIARSDRGHSTSLPLADALALGTLVALRADGLPLAIEHGGPVRIVVPHRYFYKSLKWLAQIELLAEDRLGYWEATAGYHNSADPWQEQRYIAPALTRQQAARLIAARDFSGRDLRGLDAAGRELSRLNACGALLRDANFCGCDLRGASFQGANLSNARLDRANLQGASLADADCEGASFVGADLRGADFGGASLLAATFSPSAIIDGSTRFPHDQLDSLMPPEAAYVAPRLAP